MAEMDNTELVRSFFERSCVQHDMDGESEFISEDYVLHDPSNPEFHGGREAFKNMGSACLEAIRDQHCTIEDQVAEGDRVATRWTVSGCQIKDLPGIPSKGQCFNVSGITISRISGGKIVEQWQNSDELAVRRQLGAA